MSRQTMSDTDPVQIMRQADAAFTEVLGNISTEQLALPTVNDDWDVRGLINHVINANHWAADMVRTGDAPRREGDAIGDDAPMEAYRESVDAMIAAFEEPGALGRTLHLPFEELQGAGFAAYRYGDLVGHAWDLAKATGQSTDIAPEICEMTLIMSRQRLDGLDRAHTPFKDEVVIAADACAADRLAAYLGKQVV